MAFFILLAVFLGCTFTLLLIAYCLALLTNYIWLAVLLLVTGSTATDAHSNSSLRTAACAGTTR